mgnify:CR=1 FL=1
MSFGFKGRALRSAALAAMVAAFGSPVLADEIFYVSGAVGNAVENFAKLVKPWEDATGNKVTLPPNWVLREDPVGVCLWHQP